MSQETNLQVQMGIPFRLKVVCFHRNCKLLIHNSTHPLWILQSLHMEALSHQQSALICLHLSAFLWSNEWTCNLLHWLKVPTRTAPNRCFHSSPSRLAQPEDSIIGFGGLAHRRDLRNPDTTCLGQPPGHPKGGYWKENT